MKKFSFALFLAFFAALFMLNMYSAREKKAIADSVLRLHVVAESNSKEDQVLKLKVRDAVLIKAKELFCGIDDKEEALSAAEKHKVLIEDAARKVLSDEGCALPVKVEVRKTKFPLKFYENIRLPGGVYDAVNVKIGKAEGENWWCIMYPMLCFSDSVTGKLESEGEKKLAGELGEERFRLITDTENKKIRIKFKLLEIF